MSSKAMQKPLGLRIFLTAFLVIWLIAAAFPFFWTLWGSFKVQLDFFSIADWTYALTGERTKAAYGSPFTTAGYEGAWIQEEFWRNVWNTSIVCFFVVTISLTIGTLGGYALSRAGYKYVLAQRSMGAPSFRRFALSSFRSCGRGSSPRVCSAFCWLTTILP